jgi:hydrogenase expression/formation protein HypC
MCLAVPGKIVTITEVVPGESLGRTGTVDFQGSTLEVGLDFTPDAAIGDWVLVHAGYAINQIDEEEAREVWEYLREMDEQPPLPNA